MIQNFGCCCRTIIALLAVQCAAAICAEESGDSTDAAFTAQRHSLKLPDQKEAAPYLLLKPRGNSAERPASLLIFLYGAGGSIDDYNLSRPPYDRLRELLAARGYYILVPELGPDHFMNARAERLLDAIVENVLIDHPIDRRRVHVMGTSMGGGSALAYAIHRPARIRSVCSIMGMTDLASWYNEESGYRELLEKVFGGSPAKSPEAYRQVSAMAHLDAFLHIPVFLIHGEQDTTVDPHHSQQLAAALRKRGCTVDYGQVSGTAHDDRVVVGLAEEMAEFLDRAGKVQPPAVSPKTPTPNPSPADGGGGFRGAATADEGGGFGIESQPVRCARGAWIDVAGASCHSAAAGSRHHVAAATASKVANGERTILLVDDRPVLYRPGTKRVLHPLTRHAENPMLPRDKPWEGTVAYCSVHRDPKTGHYRLWYQAWPGCYLCYAKSEDGIHWVKPNLGLVEFQGSKETNIVLKIGYGAGVLFDPRDPDAARRYKLAYWEHNGTSVAFSPDGLHWTKFTKNPVIRGSHGDYIQPPLAGDPRIPAGELGGPPLSTSDVIDPIWDPLKQCYVIYSKTWLDGPDGTMHWKRAVVRTESKDFIHWTKPVLVMAPDEHDDPAGESSLERNAGGGGTGRKQLHSGPAFVYNGIYFATLQVLDAAGTGNMPIELAVSHDGYHWQRPFRDVMFVPPLEDKTEFDASLIWSNATPIFLKDEFRFYYGAYGHPWNSADPQQISGIGLATMPRDRFAGVRPTERIGQITFKAIDLTDVTSMTINADASEGAVFVEILNEDGYRVPGFTKDDAVPIEGDRLRHVVAWKDRSLDQLPAGRYKLRLHLENAEVFAVTLLRKTAKSRGEGAERLSESPKTPTPNPSPEDGGGGFLPTEPLGMTEGLRRGPGIVADAKPPRSILQTASGVRYGVLGAKPDQPAPTLFVFAGTTELSLGRQDPYYLQAGQFLSNRGFLCVSVDLPSHGTERRDDEPEGLAGWRHRLDQDEDFISELNGRLQAVLDDLIERGYTNPQKVAACGVSRGGFVACHFAAAEPRVRAVALFSPVTELTALAEFKEATNREKVKALSLGRKAMQLAGRPVFIVIGDRDKRVDTDAAIRFARALASAADAADVPNQVELHVLPEPRGHTVPLGERSFEQAARWIETTLAAVPFE